MLNDRRVDELLVVQELEELVLEVLLNCRCFDVHGPEGAVAHHDACGHEGVQVWMEVHRVPGRMDGHHRAGHAAGIGGFEGLLDRVPGCVEQQAVARVVVAEVDPQALDAAALRNELQQAPYLLLADSVKISVERGE